ncbi:TonB-dependent receptor [Luteimonas composti]|uniref:TonB-dependent receptor n=1 Tax=Luteimonas composti TaxID=398257 RepID=A0ABT6MQ33_9GAMM|nr:TonB-dependent receptor [Luteimonas composti]MDH7452218.1 TonB-dependent receptor [Luteimonas composti]
MKKSRLAQGVSIVLMMGAMQMSFAQDGKAPGGDDAGSDEKKSMATLDAIMVTSQRRVQNVQDVPLSVTAMGSEQLDRMQVATTTDLIQHVPNMSGGEASGSGSNQYTLRGLYNSETAATFDSPVGTYVDGIFLARMSANNFALFDVERIEVLRGPQGTLFGRNTTGGAVNIILKKPMNVFGGTAEVGFGDYGYWQVRGSVDLPVSETIATRVSAYQLDEDGWVRNVTVGGRNNAHASRGVRAAMTWNITDNVVWDLAADYIEEEGANIPSVKSGNRFVSRSGLQALNPLTVGRKSTLPGNYVGNDTLGITSTFRVATGLGDVEVITGYRDLATGFNVDYYDNPLPIGGYVVNQHSTHEQITQEVKLTGGRGPWNYTTGIYYFHEANDTDFATSFTLGSGVPFIETDSRFYNDTESLAVYGQFDYAFTERLTVTAGARLTDERKDIHFVDNGNPNAAAVISDDILTNAGIPLSQSERVLTPRLAAQYELSDDAMLFASATRGFKSGGWNVRGSTAATLQGFGPEQIWSYEAGLRSDWLDRRLRVNLTAFYGITDDLQIASAFIPAGGGAPAFPVGNYSGFKSYGTELEVEAAPTERLRLFAALGYNKTKYVDISETVQAQLERCQESIAGGITPRPNCGAGIITADGRIADPARAPEWTGTVGATYIAPLTSNWDFVPSVAWRYTGDYNTSATGLVNAEQSAFSQVSAGVSLERADGRLSFSGGCTNCTNESYMLSLIGGHTWWSEPRRWQVSMRVNF